MECVEITLHIASAPNSMDSDNLNAMRFVIIQKPRRHSLLLVMSNGRVFWRKENG